MIGYEVNHFFIDRYDEMKEYTTKLGDTFESISYFELGSHKYVEEIININREHIKTVIFKSGITLKLPEKSTSTIVEKLPPWRRS